MSNVDASSLGQKTVYVSQYDPTQLFPIARAANRAQIGIKGTLPFYGFDVWNAFELSWLNAKGKPVVALGEFIFPCTTTHLIESKSFKLYLNSFNNTKFDSIEKVVATMRADLSAAAGGEVVVKVTPIDKAPSVQTAAFSSIYLDDNDVDCDTYQVHADYLSTENVEVQETVYSNLLKSNCPVTDQPDWGTVQISYQGKKINHAGLLQYIVSFRDHNEFHEQCVERIFMDIMTHCQPGQLTVEARYTRRGGLDINPLRSTEKNIPPRNIRLARQ